MNNGNVGLSTDIEQVKYDLDNYISRVEAKKLKNSAAIKTIRRGYEGAELLADFDKMIAAADKSIDNILAPLKEFEHKIDRAKATYLKQQKESSAFTNSSTNFIKKS